MRTAVFTGSAPVNARSPAEVVVGSAVDMHYGKVCRTDYTLSSNVRFSLQGEFDIFNKSELAAAMEGAATPRRLTLDLRGTTFIDASILGVFVGIAQRRVLASASQVRIVNAAQNVRRLFSICELDAVFRLEDVLAAIPQTHC